jgi:hypothetical protein
MSDYERVMARRDRRLRSYKYRAAWIVFFLFIGVAWLALTLEK